jgi:monofunctional biosynthetic peptidoglycan transglycosylase
LPKKIRFFKKYLSFWPSLKKCLLNAALFLCLSSIGICALLRWMPPPTSAFMMYRHFQDLLDNHTYQSNQYNWVNAKQISPHAYAAVIAAEDQNFFNHFGFDLYSIKSSIDTFRDGGRLRGASTISQQVAKNLFLTPSKSFLRKGIEVWFTLLIELMWSKDRILTVYLNIAEFGDHIFGIEAASQHFFGISADKINSAQAAILAATLPNPIKLKTSRPSNYLFKRQRWILKQIKNLGYQRYSGKK